MLAAFLFLKLLMLHTSMPVFIYVIKALAKGFALTIKHITKSVFLKRNGDVYPSQAGYFQAQSQGIVTLAYPYQTLPQPDNGRYQLHNEIEDCIVCDKCADVCPVDCIEIVAIKSHDNIGKTSDGTTIRMYAEKFDIDMAKCCYCGLCTVVCPTQCLTMTPVFDFSTYEIREMNFAFSQMDAETARQKREEYENRLREKQTAQTQPNSDTKAFISKPQQQPSSPSTPTINQNAGDEKNMDTEPKPKIVFKRKSQTGDDKPPAP